MIDLHLHLDGSLDENLIKKLAEMQNIELKSNLKDEIYAPKDCKNLNDYLRCFTLPLSLLQTQEALEFASFELCKKLKLQGLIYAEIRFAPLLCIKKGLSIQEATNAVVSGIKKSGFFANAILCCMRGASFNQNCETVDVAKKLLHKGVEAVDLAGAEGIYPTSDYKALFKYATENNVPFTIHAGEADGAKSVLDAISYGAKRIGHGIHAIDDKNVIDLLVKNDIALEMCPTSNFQTKAVKNIADYPLRSFMEKGVKVTINTDNMVVSNTTIDDEFLFLEKNYNLSKYERKILLKNAIDSAFISENDKKYLLNKI